MWITENILDQWVRGNAREAQGVIVELVFRLVAASAPKPRDRRFPLGDSIGQHGPDGILIVDQSVDPFVPAGRSFWEIGTSTRVREKATEDYTGLVSAIPADLRADSTFTFVSPLSAARSWEHTWKADAQASWLSERTKAREWKDVRVIDGTKLVDWVLQFPAVELWLRRRIEGPAITGLETPQERWEITRSFGDPPPLTVDLFLANRGEARRKLTELLADITKQLRLETRYPDQVVDFVCAHLMELDEDSRIDAAGRCLIVSSVEAWNTIVAYRAPHVLIADSMLDLSGDLGLRLVQKARRGGHAVISGGPSPGIPDPTTARLPAPQAHEIQAALEKAGYTEGRARTLAHRSGRNLGSLLRCLQNLSTQPAWADGSAAADLSIAELLGGWTESDADRAIVEQLEGNSYGEWIGRMRELSLRSGTPLVLQSGEWSFAMRFEGWYALGPHVFDEHLIRIRRIIAIALGEADPQFDLPKDERYTATMYGKVLTHSTRLRRGLADTIALLGSHSAALTSCSPSHAERTAVLCVRDLLTEADSVRWASLNDVTPALAEAAPEEFLRCIERTLSDRPSVFDALFAEEGGAIGGRNYTTGLLWALETLGWDPSCLGRVALCLAGLAERDPGGRWSNRPSTSLRTIFLPWLPQTCAPVDKRVAAVSAVLRDYPDVGWKLVVGLLPEMHDSSSYAARPVWRSTIPDEWTAEVTPNEYEEQVGAYADLALEAAQGNVDRLIELLRHVNRLPGKSRGQLMDYLESDVVLEISDVDRYELWSALTATCTLQRRLSHAPGSIHANQAERLVRIAERFAPHSPILRHRRLFGEREFDLYDDTDDIEEQNRRIEARRTEAIAEIVKAEGANALVDFASLVESPWRVGIIFGATADETADSAVLPELFNVNDKSRAQFAGAFILGRYRSKGSDWVDGIQMANWTPDQIGEFLSFLPFTRSTWDRVSQLLTGNPSAYWNRATPNQFEATPVDLVFAAQQFLLHGRPRAAINCLHGSTRQKHRVESSIVIRALLDGIASTEGARHLDSYQVIQLIKILQDDESVDAGGLFNVEWAYLPLLTDHHGASPKLLGHRLSSDAAFFCQLIRLLFRSQDSEQPKEPLNAQETAIAENGYRLLREWRVPPGTLVDGSFDGSALIAWMNDMKADASSTGHLEIAMTMVGHVLTYVPCDGSGLWIHRAAAEILNAKDASDLRDGYRTQIFNSRGLHWMDPSGKPEQELMEKYRAQADEVDQAGYPRLATTMRELASTYQTEFERIRSEHQFEW